MENIKEKFKEIFGVNSQVEAIEKLLEKGLISEEKRKSWTTFLNRCLSGVRPVSTKLRKALLGIAVNEIKANSFFDELEDYRLTLKPVLKTLEDHVGNKLSGIFNLQLQTLKERFSKAEDKFAFLKELDDFLKNSVV